MRPWMPWLFPLIFVVHDGEEILTAAGWVNAHQDLLAKVGRIHPAVRHAIAGLPATTSIMAAAVGFEFVLIVALTIALGLWLRGRWQTRWPLYLYAGALAACLAHVVTHVGFSLITRMYTPGVVSAVLFVPWVGGYLYARLARATALGTREAVFSTLLGIACLLPMILMAHAFGRWLCSRGPGF